MSIGQRPLTLTLSPDDAVRVARSRTGRGDQTGPYVFARGLKAKSFRAAISLRPCSSSLRLGVSAVNFRGRAKKDRPAR